MLIKRAWRVICVVFFGLQVVVLRVSLHCHCRGCQGKVKKHLSKMQGESSVLTVLTLYCYSIYFSFTCFSYQKQQYIFYLG